MMKTLKLTIDKNTLGSRIFVGLACLVLLFATHLPVAAQVTPAAEEAVSNSNPQLRVGTYNILGSMFVHTGRSIGGSVEARARRATEVVKKGHDGRAMDIVGFQEMASDQKRMFRRMLPGYAVYPAAGNNTEPIFWRTARLKLIGSSYVSIPWYGDRNLNRGHLIPWVKLQDKKTKKVMFVINHRAVAWNEDPGSDAGGALKRERTARILLGWANSLIKKKHNVIVLGDFNSALVLRNRSNFGKIKDDALKGNRDRLTYCILTSTNKLRNTFDDAQDSGSGKCPTKHYQDLLLVDFIYTSHRFKTLAWKQLRNQKTAHASDHYPSYTDIVLDEE